MKDFLHKIGTSELQSLATSMRIPLSVTYAGKTIEKNKAVLVDDIDLALSTLTESQKINYINPFLQSGRMHFFPFRFTIESNSFSNATQHYNVIEHEEYYIYEPKTLDKMIEGFYVLKPKNSDFLIVFKKGLSGLSLPISKIGNILNANFNIKIDIYLHIDTVKKLFIKIQNTTLKHVVDFNGGKVGIFFYSYASAKTHLSVSAKIDNSNKVIKKDLTSLVNSDLSGVDAMQIVNNPISINTNLLNYSVINPIPEVLEGIKEVKLNFLYKVNSNVDRLLVTVRQREFLMFNVDATTDDILKIIRAVKFMVP